MSGSQAVNAGLMRPGRLKNGERKSEITACFGIQPDALFLIGNLISCAPLKLGPTCITIFWSAYDWRGTAESEPIAFPRGFNIGGGVGRQQQAVSDEGSGSGFDPSDIGVSGAIAFF